MRQKVLVIIVFFCVSHSMSAVENEFKKTLLNNREDCIKRVTEITSGSEKDSDYHIYFAELYNSCMNGGLLDTIEIKKDVFVISN